MTYVRENRMGATGDDSCVCACRVSARTCIESSLAL
jgi:hypothetical protein